MMSLLELETDLKSRWTNEQKSSLTPKLCSARELGFGIWRVALRLDFNLHLTLVWMP